MDNRPIHHGDERDVCPALHFDQKWPDGVCVCQSEAQVRAYVTGGDNARHLKRDDQ